MTECCNDYKAGYMPCDDCPDFGINEFKPPANSLKKGHGVLIVFGGRAGSGKTTAAKHLVDRHGFRSVKMAGPLKAMLTSLLHSAGLEAEDIQEVLEGANKEKRLDALNGRTGRHAMQTLGEEWGRQCIGEDFWVSVALEKTRKILDKGHDVVVDDVRYPNELRAFKSIGAYTCWIARAQEGIAGGDHVSEASISSSDFDTFIENDFGLNGFYGDVDEHLFQAKRPKLDLEYAKLEQGQGITAGVPLGHDGPQVCWDVPWGFLHSREYLWRTNDDEKWSKGPTGLATPNEIITWDGYKWDSINGFTHYNDEDVTERYLFLYGEIVGDKISKTLDNREVSRAGHYPSGMLQDAPEPDISLHGQEEEMLYKALFFFPNSCLGLSTVSRERAREITQAADRARNRT